MAGLGARSIHERFHCKRRHVDIRDALFVKREVKATRTQMAFTLEIRTPLHKMHGSGGGSSA